jgi:beta-glucosidase
VLVLVDGRPPAIPALAERLPAILHAWLPGQEGGPAIADVIFGRFNPGGRLPVSVPRSTNQAPLFYGHKPSGGQSYNFIDYLDQSVQPLYPFGHGLSYTQFEYSDLCIDPPQVAPLGAVTVRLTVTNIGERLGDEVVQLYLRDELASLTRPVMELKGFQRLSLAPGASCRLVFTVSAAQLAFYNLHMEYVVEPGFVEVMVGASSQDIRLRGRLEIVGETIQVASKVFWSSARRE